MEKKRMHYLKNLYCLLLALLVSFTLGAQQNSKHELRAAWIATVANIDWPSQKGLNAHQQQAEYVTLLDTLKSVGMNAVIVQVRPVADALYPSSYEPWSAYLSGQQGKSPEPYYNPLTFMIEEARKRGLEFHAWFNPYRASMNDTTMLARSHPMNKHPEWFLKYGGKWYYDPGHPEAQEFVLQSILETVRHYDLDAVHFDDYFYPYRVASEVFPDSCSYADHGRDDFANVDDWRRSNVNYFVQELADRIKHEKPHVKFGISPFGVWRNRDKDPAGSATQAGQTNYDDLYADVLKWLKEGWIDYITPQLYWNIGFNVGDYKVLVDWWSKNSYGKHLYIGQAAYRIGGKGWEDPEELPNQVELNRTYSEVNGSMYFSSKIFLENKLNINLALKKLNRHPALIPPMPWIDSTPPTVPLPSRPTGSQGKGVVLTWRDSSGTDTRYYVIYKFKKGDSVSVGSATNIVAILPRQTTVTQCWTDTHAARRTTYLYGITAVDRTHNESQMSTILSVKVRGKRKAVKSMP